MSEESTTPDLVELMRRACEAGNRHDWDVMSLWGPAPVLVAEDGFTFEGRATICGFFEDWVGAYEEFEIEAEEILDLGNGVTLP
jgi:hypothetical protein